MQDLRYSRLLFILTHTYLNNHPFSMKTTSIL